MQPIQGNNPAVFDVSGPIRAGGGSNPIEQFLATLNPVQREQFLALPPEQQQAYASGGSRWISSTQIP
jgi:hypothetical protein